MANADSVPEVERQRETAAADKVSLREKIGLGFGKGLVDGSHGTLHVLISPIYVMTMGLSPALVSTIVFIQRIWDAMLDPFVGQYSDNFRSRWGRRVPLMFTAALPLAFFFAAMWWFPAGVSHEFLFVFLLGFSLMFYAAHTLFAMPLGGLIIEATDDYHERTRIAGVTLAFGFAVQVGSQWIFPLTQMEFWGGTVNGVRWVSVGCAFLFLLAGLVPVLLCKERLYKKVAVRQKRVGLLEGLRAVKGNKSFTGMLLARCVFSFGFNAVGMLSNYLYVYLVFGGDLKESAVYYGFIGSSYHVAAIVTSLLVYPRLERWIGKKRTFQVAAAVMLLGCVGKIFFYQPGWIWLPMIVTITNGIANAGVALMSVAMLADIADLDEIQTGLRREGLFTSLLSWVDKAGNSLGAFITGFILVWVGFLTRPEGTPKEVIIPQSESTLWLMKLSYVIIPAIGATATIWFVRHYALTQSRMYQIKDELARRRALAAAADAETPVA
jgi:glycoside/pentoside/hexuronide:cation symporter, GPH family